MDESTYAFSESQRAFLDALKDGRYRGGELTDYGQRRVSLQDRMPPVYQQSMRGTCVANAATALLEYYEDRKVRLSVQFLYEMTKTVERKWLDENLRALEDNRDVDSEFAAKFPVQVAQIRLTIENNGKGSPAAKAFLNAFARQLGERFNDNAGSQVKRCFEAIREFGTCRYSLWPYANMQVADSTTSGTLPPGSQEDAFKHRVLTGLYLLRSPNNVDEIRGIIAGANGRRPMPVCVGLPLFEGCDEADFCFPAGVESNGRLVSRNAFKGIHEMLIVGFEEDRKVAGGGWFIIRNSWGANWGENGYGRVPYAYVECFCTEAGTILQDMVDYVGDGYGAKAARPNDLTQGRVPKRKGLGRYLGIGCLLISVSILAVLTVLFVMPKTAERGAVPVDANVTSQKTTGDGNLKDARAPVKSDEAESARLRMKEELKRQAEERRLAEERRMLEAEKTRFAQERRAAEERAVAEANAARIAAETAMREAVKKREAAERQAAEAEKRRQEEEAEKRRLAEAAERERTRTYLVHVTLMCGNEAERDAVVKCLNELPGSFADGATNSVDNITVVEYENGRNLIGVAQKGYRVLCDVRMSGAGGVVLRPTDEIKRILSRTLNERCQFEGEDQIDWSRSTRMSCRGARAGQSLLIQSH